MRSDKKPLPVEYEFAHIELRFTYIYVQKPFH